MRHDDKVKRLVELLTSSYGFHIFIGLNLTEGLSLLAGVVGNESEWLQEGFMTGMTYPTRRCVHYSTVI